eukprot:s5760_g4.t1
MVEIQYAWFASPWLMSDLRADEASGAWLPRHAVTVPCSNFRCAQEGEVAAAKGPRSAGGSLGSSVLLLSSRSRTRAGGASVWRPYSRTSHINPSMISVTGSRLWIRLDDLQTAVANFLTRLD